MTSALPDLSLLRITKAVSSRNADPTPARRHHRQHAALLPLPLPIDGFLTDFDRDAILRKQFDDTRAKEVDWQAWQAFLRKDKEGGERYSYSLRPRKCDRNKRARTLPQKSQRDSSNPDNDQYFDDTTCDSLGSGVSKESEWRFREAFGYRKLPSEWRSGAESIVRVTPWQYALEDDLTGDPRPVVYYHKASLLHAFKGQFDQYEYTEGEEPRDKFFPTGYNVPHLGKRSYAGEEEYDTIILPLLFEARQYGLVDQGYGFDLPPLTDDELKEAMEEHDAWLQSQSSSAGGTATGEPVRLGPVQPPQNGGIVEEEEEEDEEAEAMQDVAVSVAARRDFEAFQQFAAAAFEGINSTFGAVPSGDVESYLSDMQESGLPVDVDAHSLARYYASVEATWLYPRLSVNDLHRLAKGETTAKPLDICKYVLESAARLAHQPYGRPEKVDCFQAAAPLPPLDAGQASSSASDAVVDTPGRGAVEYTWTTRPIIPLEGQEGNTPSTTCGYFTARLAIGAGTRRDDDGLPRGMVSGNQKLNAELEWTSTVALEASIWRMLAGNHVYDEDREKFAVLDKLVTVQKTRGNERRLTGWTSAPPEYDPIVVVQIDGRLVRAIFKHRRQGPPELMVTTGGANVGNFAWLPTRSRGAMAAIVREVQRVEEDGHVDDAFNLFQRQQQQQRWQQQQRSQGLANVPPVLYASGEVAPEQPEQFGVVLLADALYAILDRLITTLGWVGDLEPPRGFRENLYYRGFTRLQWPPAGSGTDGMRTSHPLWYMIDRSFPPTD